MWRIVGMVVIGVLACAERPNFNQDEIGDVCEVAADCGTSDAGTSDYGWMGLSQGSYVMEPITFRGDAFECRERQCCLPDDRYDPVTENYFSLTEPYDYEDGNVELEAPLRCQRDADCCTGSQCAHVYYEWLEGYFEEQTSCRPTCDSASDCASERCVDGVCVSSRETVVQASHP
jgi:hypothetical protein